MNNATGSNAVERVLDDSDIWGVMQAFFEMAERDIQERNNSDFDNMRLLVRGAKVAFDEFSRALCEAQGLAVSPAL